MAMAWPWHGWVHVLPGNTYIYIYTVYVITWKYVCICTWNANDLCFGWKKAVTLGVDHQKNTWHVACMAHIWGCEYVDESVCRYL